MPKRALIGHTGFVGANLQHQSKFDACFNTRNSEQLAGQTFGTVVCAGAPAHKWLANREPEADMRGLAQLANAIDSVECDRFVLISTSDVYPVPDDADESYACEQLPNHAYGTHRLWLEQRVRARFPNALIVRLPTLFGPGLKSNLLHDLMYDQALAAINPASMMQWYGLSNLTHHIDIALRHGLTLVNLFTEPLRVSRVCALFPELARRVGQQAAVEVSYNLTTEHAELFGGAAGYVQSGAVVLSELAAYVRSQRAKAAS
ncbi:MAG: hypothetical protein RL701_1446 [Pseudomonadota bacterium]|jgi:hypothetical protein